MYRYCLIRDHCVAPPSRLPFIPSYVLSLQRNEIDRTLVKCAGADSSRATTTTTTSPPLLNWVLNFLTGMYVLP